MIRKLLCWWKGHPLIECYKISDIMIKAQCSCLSRRGFLMRKIAGEIGITQPYEETDAR